MSKFRVMLSQTVYERATVEVEAATPDEAERRALDLALNGDVEWRFDDTSDGPEVVSCEALPAAQAGMEARKIPGLSD